MEIFHNNIKDLHSYILFKFLIISVNYLLAIIKLIKKSYISLFKIIYNI